jgi:fucose permease
MGYLFDNSSHKPMLLHISAGCLIFFFFLFAFIFPSEQNLILLLLCQGTVKQILMNVLITLTLQGLKGDIKRYGEVRAYGQVGNAIATLLMG